VWEFLERELDLLHQGMEQIENEQERGAGKAGDLLKCPASVDLIVGKVVSRTRISWRSVLEFLGWGVQTDHCNQEDFCTGISCSVGIKFQLICGFQHRGVLWKFKEAEQEISKE